MHDLVTKKTHPHLTQAQCTEASAAVRKWCDARSVAAPPSSDKPTALWKELDAAVRKILVGIETRGECESPTPAWGFAAMGMFGRWYMRKAKHPMRNLANEQTYVQNQVHLCSARARLG